MGDLIMMTRPAHPVRRDAPRSGEAEILFFTGVRYTRVSDPEAALASVTPPRRATKPRRRPSKAAETGAKRA